MRRDRITFAMMLGVPLMQLVLFGFAINNDPKSLPAALVATSNDRFTRAMVSALQITGYYRFDHVVASAARGRGLMAKRRRRLRRHHPVRFRAAGRARRQAADPDRGGRDRSRRRRAAPSRRWARWPPGAAARAGHAGRRPPRRRAASSGGRAPALQSRGHLAIQHRARPARRHPADDDGDDDLDRADPRDRARHDGKSARHAGQPRSRSCSARSLPYLGRRRACRWRWC